MQEDGKQNESMSDSDDDSDLDTREFPRYTGKNAESAAFWPAAVVDDEDDDPNADSRAVAFSMYLERDQEHVSGLAADSSVLRLHGPMVPIPPVKSRSMASSEVTPYAAMKIDKWEQRRADIRTAILNHPKSHLLMAQPSAMEILQALSGRISRLLSAQWNVDKVINEEAIGSIVSIGNSILTILPDIVPTLLSMACTDPIVHSVFTGIASEATQNVPAIITVIKPDSRNRLCSIPPFIGYCLDSLVTQYLPFVYEGVIIPGVKISSQVESSLECILTGQKTLEGHFRQFLSAPDALGKIKGYVCPGQTGKKCKKGLCRYHCQLVHGTCYHKQRR